MSADSKGVDPTSHAMSLDKGEATDVLALHAAVSRERPDPEEGEEPVSLWLVAFIALLLFWAGSYLTQYSGGFRADEFNENQINPKPPPSRGGGAEDPVTRMAQRGAAVYSANCAACHQADGNGTPGLFPPLAGSEWVVEEGPGRIIRIVLHGLQGPIEVKGVTYNNAMNSFGPNLDDGEIAAVLTYIRNMWGNKADMVTTEQVATVRSETSTRTAAWTAAELLEMSAAVGGGGSSAPAALTPEQIRALLEALSDEDRQAILQGL